MYTCLTRYTNSPIVSGTCTETLYRLKRAVGMSLIGRMQQEETNHDELEQGGDSGAGRRADADSISDVIAR